MMRVAAPLALVALTMGACEAPEVIVSNGAEIDSVAVQLAVHGDDGRAVVRAVNSYGVATVGVDGSLQVDGATVTVPLDSTGYGLLDVQPGTHDIDGAIGHDAVHGFANEWSGLGVGPSVRPVGVATELARGSTGTLAAVDDAVWWVGLELPPHPVVQFQGVPVDGVRSEHIDNDGVMDGIVWGGDTVILLRGRAAGGHSWGFGLKADGWAAEGVALADMDGDARLDLIVAWTSSDGHLVQFWAGDGEWGFAPSHERAILDRPLDVATAFDRGDDKAVATVLTDNGSWQRFTSVGPGEYLITGPTMDVGSKPGATVHAAHDINKDGADEVIVIQPRTDMAEREAYLWDFTDNAVNFLRSAPIGAHFALADANQDGFEQLWILDQQEMTLQHLGWSGEQYLYQSSSEMPEVGLMGIGDVDDDGLVDLMVAGTSWAWWPGWLDEEAGGRWRPRRQLSRSVEVGLVGDIAWVDADANAATDEIVGVSASEGVASIKLWSVHGADPLRTWSVALPTVGAEEVLDLAVCGADVWVLSETQAVHVDVARQRIVGAATVEGPLAIACGEGPDGVRAVVSAKLQRVELSGTAEIVNTVGREDLGAVLVDRGNGPEVVTCEQPCIAWPYGAEGQVAIVSNMGDHLQIDVGDEAPLIRAGAGQLSVQDVDGDGLLDLVSSMGVGHIAVLRSTGDGIGQGTFGHVPATWQGTTVFADTDGDSTRDVVMGRDGALAYPRDP